MRSVVLLSAGCHPVSGRAAPVTVEMQAIRLACELGAAPFGLHVGDNVDRVRDALGHGLSRLVMLQAGDPLPALRDYLSGQPQDLVLAGRRGAGGTDSGMLPYRLAHVLGWPLVHDVVGLARQDARLLAAQALPRGARRYVSVSIPCVVTVHPAAPAAQPFRQAGLRGKIENLASAVMPVSDPPPLLPYRMRPKIMERASGGGRVLRDISPEAAAEAILGELRRLGHHYKK